MSETETKTVTDSKAAINEDYSGTEDAKLEQKSSGSLDPLRKSPHDFKSLGVVKMELLNSQADALWFKAIMLFTTFLVGFAYMLDAQIRYTFTSYATGAFNNHTLLSTINVVTTVIAAGGQTTYARLVDTFGRIEMYIFSMLLYVIGTIIQCRATNVPRFACGAVFYQLGFVGIVLILVVMLSDLSSMRWRLFFILAPTYSFIIITWIAGNVSSSVGPVEHWSWGIGMWAFIFPLANIPFLSCLGYMWFKARQLDEWKGLAGFKRRILKEQGVGKFLVDLFWDLDIVGAILMVVCLGCILVPLTLAGGVHSKWQNYQIYVPIIIGGVLIPVFILWEKYFSKNPIAPMLFFTNRGIWCPLAISFLFMFIDMTVQEYLYTVLVVAVNQSVTSATRITSLPSFVGEIVGLLYGLFTVEIRRLKPFLVFGTSMWMLSLGLMYYYRGGSSSKAGIIAAQCVMGFGTGFFSYPITVVMQSNVKHEHLAVVTGLGYALYRIGGAVGSSVGGAIWSQLLYKELLKRLGDSTEAASCFNDPFTYILDQPWGTAVRNEIVMAYRHVQRILILVGLVFCAPLILLAILTKDRKLSKEVSLEHENGEEEPFSVIQWIKGKYADRKEAKSELS